MNEEVDPQAAAEPVDASPAEEEAGRIFDDEEADEAPSGIGAIIGPFFNAILGPADCWKALNARPVLSLWIAFWVMAFSTVLAIINLPITQQAMVAVSRAQLQARGTEITPEAARSAAETMMFIGTITAYASSVFLLVMIGLVALLIWVFASIMGGKGATFARSFGIAAAAGVIRPLLYSVYATVILQLNPPEIRRVEDLTTMTPTLGLDLLLSGPDTPTWLNAILQRIDLFNLWWMAIVISGCVALLKLSKGQGTVVAVLIWILGTLIAAGGAWLQTAG